MGCVYIDYPPDWDTVGFETYGRTRNGIGELASAIGVPSTTPPWVGGELLCGTVTALRGMVEACEQLDAQLDAEGKTLPNEEQILSLAGAVGRVRFADLSNVARRITTGPRSHALPRRCRADRSLAPAGGEGAEPAPHRPADPAAGARAA